MNGPLQCQQFFIWIRNPRWLPRQDNCLTKNLLYTNLNSTLSQQSTLCWCSIEKTSSISRYKYENEYLLSSSWLKHKQYMYNQVNDTGSREPLFFFYIKLSLWSYEDTKRVDRIIDHLLFYLFVSKCTCMM